MRKDLVPSIANMETSTYLILALVKGAPEYLDAGVTDREKGGGKGAGQGRKEARGRV